MHMSRLKHVDYRIIFYSIQVQNGKKIATVVSNVKSYFDAGCFWFFYDLSHRVVQILFTHSFLVIRYSITFVFH